MIGLAPDNHGTTLLGLTKLLPYFPGAEDLLNANTPGLADQVAGSPFIAKLNAGGDTVPGVRYTVIATRYDEVVTPYRTQFLDGPGPDSRSGCRGRLLYTPCQPMAWRVFHQLVWPMISVPDPESTVLPPA